MRVDYPTKGYFRVVDDEIHTTRHYEEASPFSMLVMYRTVRIQYQAPNGAKLFFTVHDYASPVKVLPEPSGAAQYRVAIGFYLFPDYPKRPEVPEPVFVLPE